MTTPAPFDPTGPLPSGRSVLEASAGTGKTWTIAALVTRYVAEAGIPIDRILAVTFTRAATGELRERVRSRLAGAARALESGADPGGDPVLARLAADPSRRDLHLARLRAALTAFDQATITTLHGFAGRILGSLGFLAGVPDGSPLEPDHGVLRDEAISDLLVARFAGSADAPVPQADLREIAASVLTNPDALIVPDPRSVEEPAAARAELARRLRPELARRAQAAGIVTYDDLLVRVRDALAGPEVGEQAARLAGSRYDVALIDEFQDTDRIQWDIVARLFPPEGSTLVVIGDPKQAIYAFRGADVDAYLEAVSESGARHTLPVNWRSDGPLISALDTLLSGVEFGDPRIPYRSVEPAPGNRGTAITGVAAPLLIRHVGRKAPIRQTSGGSTFTAAGLRRFVAADVAAYAVGLLGSGVTVQGEPLRPGDVAVLCRTGAQVDQVKAALVERQVPAVVGRTGSVFASPAASEWRTLLRALEHPSSPGRARQAALTPFIGWSPAQLMSASDDDLLPLHDTLAAWAQVLSRRGVPALVDEVERTRGLTRRLLSRPDGERAATDLAHVAELMHGSRRAGGVRGLLAWLEAEILDSGRAVEPGEARARRLETDADAVQVLTVHAAKGLEFPVVLAPFLWDVFPRDDPVPVYHPDGSAGREVDVGGPGWAGFAAHQRQARAEDSAEEMRLLYVALTRARHHVAVWWGRYKGAVTAPLTRILYGHRGDGHLPDEVSIVTDERMLDRLRALVAPSEATIAVELREDEPGQEAWYPPPTPVPVLDAASFDREVDHLWRRTSFSGITAAAHAAWPAADPEAPVTDDEPATGEEPAAPAAPLPYAAMPAGARFGTLVHDILEEVDFAATDLDERLAVAASDQTARAGLDLDPQALAAALALTLRTPLGPDGSARLVDLSPSDRVAEMEFELSVATTSGSVGVDDLAALLDDHLPRGHPLAAYPGRLREMGAGRFRGFLTGSIDLVARTGGRYLVIDYKTNRLDWPEPDLAAYRPEGLAAAMVEGDYVLQALLYQVALHRHLRSRLPGYDPAGHLGGAAWLFVRGMIGPDTPVVDGTRLGVFAWQPGPPLLEAVSDLFIRGGPA